MDWADTIAQTILQNVKVSKETYALDEEGMINLLRDEIADALRKVKDMADVDPFRK
jgi:hypothetical protein